MKYTTKSEQHGAQGNGTTSNLKNILLIFFLTLPDNLPRRLKRN